jgi:EAL domain-containing protein (putative c-di-GMP-specific phosphodiesterase class I)
VLWTDADLATASALDVLGAALAAEPVATIAARAAHGAMLDALANGIGVRAMYQPMVEIRTGQTTAFEALLRLEFGGRVVPPAEVFRAATDTGRLAAADAAARRAAICGASGWIGPRTLFLNVVPDAVARPDVLDDTDAAVELAGLARAQIAFEAPVPHGDPRHLERVLSHLRARGFGVGLDDVTSDAAALRLVEAVRPGSVKIDRALVAELPSVPGREALAAVVGVAHAVGARVVAKGIETAAQLDAAMLVGVDDAQGWQVGQPMRPPGRVGGSAS